MSKETNETEMSTGLRTWVVVFAVIGSIVVSEIIKALLN